MPTFSPWMLLAIAIAGLYLIWQIDRIVSRRRASRLRQIAAAAKVQYSRLDRFGIAARLHEGFPVKGASDFHVRDLMYCRGSGCYSYVFTALYRDSDGRRRRCVGSVEESAETSAEHLRNIKLGPVNLPLEAQYRALIGRSV